jgi:hypothetical protein
MHDGGKCAATSAEGQTPARWPCDAPIARRSGARGRPHLRKLLEAAMSTSRNSSRLSAPVQPLSPHTVSSLRATTCAPESCRLERANTKSIDQVCFGPHGTCNGQRPTEHALPLAHGQAYLAILPCPETPGSGSRGQDSLIQPQPPSMGHEAMSPDRSSEEGQLRLVERADGMCEPMGHWMFECQTDAPPCLLAVCRGSDGNPVSGCPQDQRCPPWR